MKETDTPETFAEVHNERLITCHVVDVQQSLAFGEAFDESGEIEAQQFQYLDARLRFRQDELQ